MWDAIKDYLSPEVIWFLAGLALLILEFAMPGLVIFFFGVGACVVALVYVVTPITLNVQLIVFIGASVLSLLLLRRWLKGVFMGHAVSKQNLKENLEEYVGQHALVIQRIVPKAGGKVEFHGTNWMAHADQEIAEGTVVEIIDKDNITFKVKAL